MKTIISILSLLVIAFFCFAIVLYYFCYPMTGFIVEIDYDQDLIVIEDANGFLWEWQGIEDYSINDIVSMLMFSNFSKTIFDDSIILIRFSGFQM